MEETKIIFFWFWVWISAGSRTTFGKVLKLISIFIRKFTYLLYFVRITIPLPENIIQVAGVVSTESNTLILKDGSRIQAEVFIYCTGYEYAFPFLDETSGLTIEDNRVAPLYKHMVNVQHPSMAFMGLPTVVALFTVSHVQVMRILSMLNLR